MKTKYKCFILQAFIFGFLFIFIDCQNEYECERSTPIKYNDGPCELRVCIDEELLDGVCVVANEIAETQYLYLKGVFDEHKNSKFDLIKFSNGDVVSIIIYYDFSDDPDKTIIFFCLSFHRKF